MARVDSDGQLDWYLLDRPENQKLRKFFREINAFYKKTAALWEVDFDWAGFEWLVPDDNHNNVVVFLRKDQKGRDLLCAVNFSPNTYENYRMASPLTGSMCPCSTPMTPSTAETASGIGSRDGGSHPLSRERTLRRHPHSRLRRGVFAG